MLKRKSWYWLGLAEGGTSSHQRSHGFNSAHPDCLLTANLPLRLTYNGASMNACLSQKWVKVLDHHVWPQIHSLMLNDAYFKLFTYARLLTGKFSGYIGEMIETGYVTFQTITIRRLCDKRRDVISLRRVLMELNSNDTVTSKQISCLFSKLDRCAYVCNMANNYVAHMTNPHHRNWGVNEWNLQVQHLTEAQRAICEVAIEFDRDILRRQNPVKIIPVPQGNIMEEFKPWVSADDIRMLWQFWHQHNAAVNSWITKSSRSCD